MLRSTRIRLGMATAALLVAGGVTTAVPAIASAAPAPTPAPAVRPQTTLYTFVGLYSDPNGRAKCNEAGQDLVFSGQYDRYRCGSFPGIPGTFELDGGTDI